MIRLFAHRGFAKGNILQNSIASLNHAHKNGFKAIEFDIWFLMYHPHLIVSYLR